MAITLHTKPIVLHGHDTGMVRAWDSVHREAFVASTGNGRRISQCYGRLSELPDMQALSHPVLVAHDLVGHPGKAQDGELLRLDPHKKTCQVFLSGFEDARTTPAGEIALLRGGAWVYFDVMGHPIASPQAPLPPPATSAAASPAAPVAPTPPAASAVPTTAAPLCPPSGPAIVTPRTALVLPPALANKCDASGAPCYPTFVPIPAGSINRVFKRYDERWTIDGAAGQSGSSFAPFFISQTVISNAMFEEYCRSSGRSIHSLSNRSVPPRLAGSRQPAVMMTRPVAEGYATWLRHKLCAAGVKADVYLPGRLRWEYVARAGRYGPAMTHVTSTGNYLPAPPAVQPLAHWNATDPVDVDDTTFDPIVHGGSELYHLGGNVWEWTTDTNDNGWSMVCGGAWNSRNEQELRIDYALLVNPAGTSPFIGFRVCVELAP